MTAPDARACACERSLSRGPRSTPSSAHASAMPRYPPPSVRHAAHLRASVRHARDPLAPLASDRQTQCDVRGSRAREAREARVPATRPKDDGLSRCLVSVPSSGGVQCCQAVRKRRPPPAPPRFLQSEGASYAAPLGRASEATQSRPRRKPWHALAVQRSAAYERGAGMAPRAQLTIVAAFVTRVWA